MHVKLERNSDGKYYKQLAWCRKCGKKFVVKKNSEVYGSKYHAMHYCKKCYVKYVKDYIKNGKKES